MSFNNKKYFRDATYFQPSIFFFMKKHFALLFILAFAVIGTLYAVTDNTKEAKTVALNFLNALKAKEYAKAKKYGTEATGRVIDMLESYPEDSVSAKTKSVKIVSKIKEAKIDGDKCVITYESSDNPGEDRTMNLVNNNGKWLVEMTKEDTDE